jgi:hypothetical protein
LTEAKEVAKLRQIVFVTRDLQLCPMLIILYLTDETSNRPNFKASIDGSKVGEIVARQVRLPTTTSNTTFQGSALVAIKETNDKEDIKRNQMISCILT